MKPPYRPLHGRGRRAPQHYRARSGRHRADFGQYGHQPGTRLRREEVQIGPLHARVVLGRAATVERELNSKLRKAAWASVVVVIVPVAFAGATGGLSHGDIKAANSAAGDQPTTTSALSSSSTAANAQLGATISRLLAQGAQTASVEAAPATATPTAAVVTTAALTAAAPIRVELVAAPTTAALVRLPVDRGELCLELVASKWWRGQV